MVFSSVEFLFLFLPVFLLLQALLPYKNVTYALASVLFYFVGEGWYSAVVVESVIANYLLGLLIDVQANDRGRKLALALGVAMNCASLAFFKYAGFICTSVLGKEHSSWVTSIHLPLGISFFSFHAISYLIDIYRRDAKAERSFVNLTLYMLMFPQLIAGPILRFHSVARRLRRRVVTARHVYFGSLLFCVGLGQKVLIADTLASVVDTRFVATAALSSSAAWLAAIAYAFQILFDFAGYSNMAMGLGWMTGFSLPRNFDQPYVSQSITEFWRRWHMSLSRWFRDYLYIPLGGNRHGPARTYANLVFVFLICGLWHGAAWTFVVWGAYHGLWLVIERLGLDQILARLPRLLRHAYALLVVLVGWVLFRAQDITHASRLLRTMFVPVQQPEASGLGVESVSRGQWLALFGAVLLCIPACSTSLRKFFWIITDTPLPRRAHWSAYARGALVALLMFSAAAINILAGSYSSFIYFRF
jgi:alginate O-acetyltransferase complex protein AlgI